jgi:hypothetical protein
MTSCQDGKTHHKISRPAATVATPSAAPSIAALNPERTRLGMFGTPLIDEVLYKRCGVAQGCAH